jgi:hypothetical protein
MFLNVSKHAYIYIYIYIDEQEIGFSFCIKKISLLLLDSSH